VFAINLVLEEALEIYLELLDFTDIFYPSKVAKRTRPKGVEHTIKLEDSKRPPY